ncbi:3-isopropylmalate dehydratase large subunit [Alkalibacillus salilacus]|uniref:3-isopropylmalate dehydratase large subunit n=1 Tax=Alkalibacillus salilacus TaxID=284582 RepID=A0ABT9VB11_9BACI|nr:3-isopropylmalate dehydratase large subunit [Alkalibacillus salilacus]MDQ0158154.1 3-isopropylmalate/(R)-2-methylmalate dehydratase large subunit [Alkalibacillus salilacus]
MSQQTLFDKVWEKHLIEMEEQQLLFIDLHLIHEVTSPQAFSKLREEGRLVRRPDLTFATADHIVPTGERDNIRDILAKKQIDFLTKNCEEFGITLYDIDHPDNGIVHIIGPELGLTTPGKTIVCGDSHTSTHGAFGSLAFGIGSSEITHVLATQTLPQKKPKTMNIHIDGQLKDYVTSKDIILKIIQEIGTNGGAGHVVEFTGSAVDDMSMEQRMTLCNMIIEAGARAGMIAPDEKTFEYLEGKRFAPRGEAWEEAVAEWKTLKTDPDASYDKTVVIHAYEISPQVTWGTNPSQGTSIEGVVPDPNDLNKGADQDTAKAALKYMDLKPLTKIDDIYVDKVFIGSCTNSRIEDLRVAAEVLRGYQVSSKVEALVVPGSYHIKRRAEEEGLDQIFINAGFDWREPGCSMCPGMNPDMAKPGERIASTSNRNFEGRQGKEARTHLVSPAMAAATAVKGHFIDVRDWTFKEDGEKNATF